LKLFSAPGSSLNDKRAWLMTPPFDRALAVPSVVVPTRTGDLEWDAADATGALAWDVPAPVLTWE
jgi:hypothetical protein